MIEHPRLPPLAIFQPTSYQFVRWQTARARTDEKGTDYEWDLLFGARLDENNTVQPAEWKIVRYLSCE
jgi:hypothetical protein